VSERGLREDGKAEGTFVEEESRTTTEMFKGIRLVEVPGAYDPERPDLAPEPITLPELRPIGDYITAPCRLE